MREILYKAKRTDNREWVEGDIINDGVTGQLFIHVSGNSVNESDKIGEEGCLKFFAFEADPKTVCQYTGLTDKNHKKIFEGDTVEINGEDGEFTVEWNPSTAMFEMSSDTVCVNFDNYFSYEAEVIGNIHNNEVRKD